MILFLLTLILIGYLAAWPAWHFGKTRVHWYRWDFGVPVYGVSIWLVMAMAGVGTTASMTNFITEIFWVFVMTVFSPWLRVIWPGKNEHLSQASSLLCCTFPVMIAVILRSVMPTLPE